MAKPQIPPNALVLKWGRLQIAASGYLAISAVLMLGVFGAFVLSGKALGWW